MIKIALAEDNSLLATSIIEKLSFFPSDLKFKFRGINGQDLIEKLEKDNNIDVILMDIQMPVMNGVDACKIVSDKYPNIKIIMLTVLDDEVHIFHSIQAGANGYILKDESPQTLFESIVEIMNGGAPMSAGIALKALKLLRNPIKENENLTHEQFDLSPREIEVLTLLSKGFEYKNIAEKLFISPSTVRKHIENIYQKLKVHNKVEAIQKAGKHRLV